MKEPMSSAQFYLPESWATASIPAVRSRDLVILCIAVAVFCASFVFAILYSSDQRYPIAAVHESFAPGTRQLPVPAAVSKPVASSRPAIEPIARNHRELLALERLGHRNYIEFSLPRSSSFVPVGPIELGFWRVDTRHDAVQGSVLIGQNRVDFRHIDVKNPVTIPLASGELLEIVVNRVSKSQISGYISEPKGATSDLALNTSSQSAVVR